MYNKNDLIRCPFCGGEADIEIGADVVSVSCKTCGKSISGFTYNPDDRPTMYDAVNTAVKEWNQIKA